MMQEKSMSQLSKQWFWKKEIYCQKTPVWYWTKLLLYLRTRKKLQMNSNDSRVIRVFNSCLIMERAWCLYLGRHELPPSMTFHHFSLQGVMESLKLKTWRFSGFVPLTWEFRLVGRNLVPENRGSRMSTLSSKYTTF